MFFSRARTTRVQGSHFYQVRRPYCKDSRFFWKWSHPPPILRGVWSDLSPSLFCTSTVFPFSEHDHHFLSKRLFSLSSGSHNDRDDQNQNLNCDGSKSVNITPTPNNPDDSTTTFSSLANMDPRIRKMVLDDCGLVTMTAIQEMIWNAVVRDEKDVYCSVPTGADKTLAFVLSMLQRILNSPKPKTSSTRVLILAPSRESVIRIGNHVNWILNGWNTACRTRTNHPNNDRGANKQDVLTSCIWHGGDSKKQEWAQLQNRIPAVFISTPERLASHLESTRGNNHSSSFQSLFSDLDVLVLDEFDRLMDYRKDLEKIRSLLGSPPVHWQTLVFSATLCHTAIRSLTLEHWHLVDRNNYTLLDCRGESNENKNQEQEFSWERRILRKIRQTHVILPTQKILWGTIQILTNLSESKEYRRTVVLFPTESHATFYAHLFNHVLGRRVWEIHSGMERNRRQMIAQQFLQQNSSSLTMLFSSHVSNLPSMSDDGGCFCCHEDRSTLIVHVGLPLDASQRTDQQSRGGCCYCDPKIAISEQSLIPELWLLTEWEASENEGWDLHLHAPLQDLLEQRLDPVLEEMRMQLSAQIRPSRNEPLKADSRFTYLSILGYHWLQFRELGISTENAEGYLLELIHQFGTNQQLILTDREVKHFRLESVVQRGIFKNVKRQPWQAGKAFDVGRR